MGSITLDPVGMLIKLLLAILVPLVVGKIFQHLPKIGPEIQVHTYTYNSHVQGSNEVLVRPGNIAALPARSLLSHNVSISEMHEN